MAQKTVRIRPYPLVIKIGLFFRTIEIANRLIILIVLQNNPILITKFHIG